MRLTTRPGIEGPHQIKLTTQGQQSFLASGDHITKIKEYVKHFFGVLRFCVYQFAERGINYKSDIGE